MQSIKESGTLDERKTEKKSKKQLEQKKDNFFSSFGFVFEEYLRSVPGLLFAVIEKSQFMGFTQEQYTGASSSNKLKALQLYQIGVQTKYRETFSNQTQIKQNKIKNQLKLKNVQQLQEKIAQQEELLENKQKQCKDLRNQLIADNYERYRKKVCPCNPLQVLYQWVHQHQNVNWNPEEFALDLQLIEEESSHLKYTSSVKNLDELKVESRSQSPSLKFKVVHSHTMMDEDGDVNRNNGCKMTDSLILNSVDSPHKKYTAVDKEKQKLKWASSKNKTNSIQEKSVIKITESYCTSEDEAQKEKIKQEKKEVKEIAKKQENYSNKADGQKQVSNESSIEKKQENSDSKSASTTHGFYRIRKIVPAIVEKVRHRKISFQHRTPIQGRKDIFH